MPCAFAIQAKIRQYDKDTKILISDAWERFKEADYKNVIIDVEKIERHFEVNHYKDIKLHGLLFYWKAISYKNLQDYVQSINYFRKAIGFYYDGEDLFYEYAQVLYASEQLKKARAAFSLSIKNKYKIAVSYYYVGDISQKLGEYKMALKAFHAIEDLPSEEISEILQPALLQIADIYYTFAKEKENLLESIEDYVIPQYEKALNVAPLSNLAPEIQTKIKEIQALFEVEVFRMRNGRPSLFPRNFVKLNAGVNYDTNVTLASNDTQSTQSDQGSPYLSTSVYARKMFYPNKRHSFSPELRFNYNKYTNTNENVQINTGYTLAYGLRNTYEHTLKNAPASFLYEWDYSTSKRDEGSDGTLDNFNSTNSFTIGERYNFLKCGESVLKYRYKTTTFEEEDSNSVSHTLSFEQVFKLEKGYTTIGYFSFDTLDVQNSTYNSDAYTAKVDLVFPQTTADKIWSASFAVVFTNPVNQIDDRGIETSLTPGLTFSKIYNRKFRGNLNYSYTTNSSKSVDYNYNKHLITYNLEYIY